MGALISMADRRNNKLPRPVRRRLPQYLIYVRELLESGVEWVSSVGLANALGLTSSTVRQDLSHLDLKGISKRGYEIEKFQAVLVHELGGDKRHRVLIVGAGFLGSALILHGALARHGFEVCAIMDVNPEILGTKVGKLPIRPMSALRQVVEEQEIDIAIITVPVNQAQRVANALIDVGIKALLNLALVRIEVPDEVALMDARIVVSLQELAYILRTRTDEENENSEQTKQQRTME